jgi:Response regulator containing a CheY-like receiver domain and an HTH DNA-binding domain
MEKTKHKHLLADIWERYPDALATDHSPKESHPVTQHLTDLLVLGPFYFFVVNVADYSVQQASENILSIHGLKNYPETLQQIIDLVHPDDLDFIWQAEEAALAKMAEIGFEHLLQLKTSYSFRMRMADGSYHLFHHQAVHLSKDSSGRLTSALNIHTDIQHLTPFNNRTILVCGVGGRNDYHRIDLSGQGATHAVPKFSKRETEVLTLLAKGLSSKQIADSLFISKETVRMHRKSLMKKAEAHNSNTLIKKCIEWGVL